MNRYESLGHAARRELGTITSASGVRATVEQRLFGEGRAHVRAKDGRVLRWTALAACVAGATAAVAVWPTGRAPVTFTVAGEGAGAAGAEVVARNEQKLIAFSDGSTIELRPRARARVVRADRDATELAVDDGGVRARVRLGTGARWVVRAGPYQVQVVGTRFDLEWDARSHRLAIEMHDGRVLVSGGALPAPRELRAGERLELGADGHPRLAPTPAASPAAVAVPPIAPPTTAPRRLRPATSPAADLFAAADRARLAGQEREAVELFERLDRKFPDDRLAGLAAFAAGRLRLLRLDDPRGALRDFERARGRGLDPALEEDRQARVVEALSRLGDRARCAEARARYLAAFPRGAHAAIVSKACD